MKLKILLLLFIAVLIYSCDNNSKTENQLLKANRFVVILIDGSGSFNSYLDTAKYEIKKFANSLEYGDKLTVRTIVSDSYRDKNLIGTIDLSDEIFKPKKVFTGKQKEKQKKRQKEEKDKQFSDFFYKLDKFTAVGNTDIEGALKLVDEDFRYATNFKNKYLIIISDLNDDPVISKTNLGISLKNIHVEAHYVTRVDKDNKKMELMEKQLRWQELLGMDTIPVVYPPEHSGDFLKYAKQ